MLSFLLDGLETDQDFDKLWNVYYHLYIDEYTFEFLAAQVEKLSAAAVSLDTWRDSKYGKALRFADAATFKDVQAGFAKYAKAVKDKNKPAYTTSFRAYIDKIKYLRKSIFDDQVPMATGYRSVAPAAEALDDITDQFRNYWKTGTSSAPTGSLLPHNIPNPAFATTASDRVLLHHAINPTLGFHLDPAYTGLTEGSPLKIKASDKLPGRDQLAKAAQIEFRAMAKAFQALHGNFTIRFTSAEALAFCYTLQNCSSSDRTELTASWYRRQQDARALELDAFEYGTGAAVKAPVAFDVVETSTMSDHLGVLNILVAAVPVLVDAASSTIHMETLIRNDVDQDETFATLLCGDTLAMSLLLGITPAEYYTNTRTTSSFDEAASEMTDGGKPENINQQLRTHMSWKLAHHFSSYSGNTSRSNKLTVAADELSALLLAVYKDMFFYEDIERLRRYMQAGPKSRMGGRQLKLRYPLYHRGSLAALMRIAMDRVDTNWTIVCEKIYNTMSTLAACPISLGPLHFAEFDTHMQMFGALPDTEPQSHKIVTVTLVVPHADLKELFKGRVTQQAISPILSVELFSDDADGSMDDERPSFSHHFDDLQTMFGTVTTTGTRGSPDYRVAVDEDSKGWHGKSQLIVSFNISEHALTTVRDTDVVALKLHSNMRCMELCQGDPSDPDSSGLVISEAEYSDGTRVFATQHMPGMAGLAKIVPPVFAPPAAAARASEVRTDLTANLDANGKATTVTGRIRIDSLEGKQLLQDPQASIKLAATPSPFVVNVVFGNDALVLPVHFTVPVAADKAKTRIARKSSWVEVIAPLTLPARSPCLEGLVYPTVLDERGLPVTLTCPHINLDVQPVVDLDIRDKRELTWLMVSTSLTFSLRESKVRNLLMSSANSTLGVSADLRLNIKESIFAIIHTASGLREESTGLVVVMHPGRDSMHMLILVSALRMDLHSGSVAVDAAAVPLTKEILAKPGVQAFMSPTQQMQVRTVNVDDAELAAWKTLLPAFSERCRTWQHTPGCEYVAARRVPVSLADGEPVLCSCGAGKLPARFVGIPMWDRVRPYATRVAITPLFCANAAEDPMDPAVHTREELWAQEQQARAEAAQREPPTDRCGVCNSRHGKGGPDVALKACSRCRKAFYCSAECQKADWKRHKQRCRA